MIIDFSQRQRALRSLMDQRGLDRLLLTHPPDWYYLTGFTGDSGALVCSAADRATLITDGRFTVQAKAETHGLRILLQKGALAGALGEFLRKKPARVGFDPVQLSVAQLRALKKASGPRTKWLEAPALVAGLRMRKDAQELAQMRRAAILAGDIVTRAMRSLKPGVQELEVAAEIEYQMRIAGASGPAFESIVAFGPRSALPHARPTGKRLKKNELVVLDLGVILGHYCSDITRTVFFGRATPRVRGWYRGVKEAQAAAVAAAKAGAACGAVDAAARNVLAGYKLDRYFVHSTGHGLGLEVHEDPRVARGQERALEPGNVITVEPGVYFPGVGGIRIEDDVAVHADATEVLTRVPRDLIEI